jgi:hypothetical protein
MSVFYVLHVKAKPLADCLDAIRFLCNPAEKHRAHITVRGPYRHKIDIDSANDKISGGIVSFDGVGNFFDSNQNTVFFRCSSPRLRAVWRKPDFPFNPHLTIYDGKSSDFAHRLFDLLRRHEYRMRFRAEQLEAIESRKGQSGMSLALAFNANLMRKAVGRRITAADVPRLSERERLDLVAQMCSYLSRLPQAAPSCSARQSALPFTKELSPTRNGAE